MKGDPVVIGHLNNVLRNELTAVNQYFLHARILQQWGLLRLGKFIYDESIGEMRHADALIKRILFLDGLPNLQDLNRLEIGENVPEILSADLRSEYANQGTVKDGIAHCESVRDFESREILVGILKDTEEHIDWLETQLDLIGRVGLQNYQQEQMFGGDDAGG